MDSDMNNNYGTSKYRRQQLNKGVEQLKKAIPLSPDDSKKLSQLQTLHFACIYMRKENLISNMQSKSNNFSIQNDSILKQIVNSQLGISDTIHGFIIAVSRSGHLVYVSDNVINYLGHNAIDVLLSADRFCDILHPLDEATIKNVLERRSNDHKNHYEFYTSWYVSKIRRRVYTRSDTKIRISGRFTEDNKLFVALCTPTLRVADRDYMDHLVASSPTCFTTVNSLDLKFLEICEKGQSILGYKEHELQNSSLYEMANLKNLKDLRKNHKSLLSNKSQRGKLETIQLLMKNGKYLNCLVNMYYGVSNYIICRFQAFSQSEMNEYDTYCALLANYSPNFSSDENEVSDSIQMSPESSDYENNSRKRSNDENSDEYYYSNDDELQSDSSDDTLQIECSSLKKPKKQRTNVKIETNYNQISTLETNVQQPTQYNINTCTNTFISNPSPQPQQVFNQIQYPANSCYSYYNVVSPSTLQNNDEILKSFAAEITQAKKVNVNDFYNSTENFLDTDWEKININDLLPYTNYYTNEELNGNFSPTQTQNYDFQLQNSLYEMDNKNYNRHEQNYSYNQDEFLDQLISILDDSERGQI